jgi:hypothetical protein
MFVSSVGLSSSCASDGAMVTTPQSTPLLSSIEHIIHNATLFTTVVPRCRRGFFLSILILCIARTLFHAAVKFHRSLYASLTIHLTCKKKNIVFGTAQLDLQLAVIYRCTLDPVFRSATMPLQRVSLNSCFLFFNTQNLRYQCLLDLLRHAGRYSRIPSSPALLESLKAQEAALWSALSPFQLQPMGIHET